MSRRASNLIGPKGYVQLTGDATSRVGFAMPSAATVDCQFEFRYSGVENLTAFNTSAGSNSWRGIGTVGVTADARTSEMFDNGVAIGASNRDVFHSRVADGDWHRLTLIGFSVSLAEVIYFGTYSQNSNFSPPAQVRDFRIDVGQTGSWTNQSYFGDSNGFVRENATVVS